MWILCCSSLNRRSREEELRISSGGGRGLKNDEQIEAKVEVAVSEARGRRRSMPAAKKWWERRGGRKAEQLDKKKTCWIYPFCLRDIKGRRTVTMTSTWTWTSTSTSTSTSALSSNISHSSHIELPCGTIISNPPTRPQWNGARSIVYFLEKLQDPYVAPAASSESAAEPDSADSRMSSSFRTR
jgi:hypothetical protein